MIDWFQSSIGLLQPSIMKKCKKNLALGHFSNFQFWGLCPVNRRFQCPAPKSQKHIQHHYIHRSKRKMIKRLNICTQNTHTLKTIFAKHPTTLLDLFQVIIAQVRIMLLTCNGRSLSYGHVCLCVCACVVFCMTKRKTDVIRLASSHPDKLSGRSVSFLLWHDFPRPLSTKPSYHGPP